MCPMSFKIGQLHYFWIVCYLQQSLSHWEECSYNIPFGSSCREKLTLKRPVGLLSFSPSSSFFLSVLCPAAMCVVSRRSWMPSLSATCRSMWTRSSGCSHSAAASVTMCAWRRPTWGTTSALGMQVQIAGLTFGGDSTDERVFDFYFLFVCLFVCVLLEWADDQFMEENVRKVLQKEKLRSNSSAKHQIFTQFAFCFVFFPVFPKQKKLTLWRGWNIRLYCFSLLLCLISCWKANVSCVLAYCCHVTRSFLNDSHFTVSLLVCSPRV